jgi:hypothetical protein
MTALQKDKRMKYQRGIALVEVIAALGVSALVITALVSLALSTLRTSLDSKLLLEGTKLANREVEMIRAYRDRSDVSWENFIQGLVASENCVKGAFCHMDKQFGHPVMGEEIIGSGAEKITVGFYITDPSRDDGLILDPYISPPQVVRVNVSVKWKIGDKDKGSYIYTDLSNWRGK